MEAQRIIEIGKRLYSRGFVYGTSGNISLKTKQDDILITGAGTSLGELHRDDIIKISQDGNDYGCHASSERYLHTAIYNLRKDVNAIIHVHSVALTTFAAARKPIDFTILPEKILCFEDIPLAPYAMPSSKELVLNTVKFFENRDIVLMSNHGVVACAKNLDDAFTKIEMAEFYAQVALNSHILGGAVSLTDKEIDDLHKLKAQN